MHGVTRTACALMGLMALLTASGPRPASAEKRVESEAERERMRDFIEKRIDRRDVKKSVQIGADEFADCVDVYAQPAMKRPELKGHTIEHAPKGFPLARPNDAPPRGTVFDDDEGFVGSDVADARSERSICPQGTVPIRRLELEELEQFRNLGDFHQKVPSHLSGKPGEASTEQLPIDGPTSEHQYAYTQQAVSNWGAESTLNLWSPSVERSNEFSLSQIWVTRGTGADRETVEAGWQVYKDKYKDTRARLFIYFTPDNYKKDGDSCYNLDCDAFVQTDNSIVLGGAWSVYSTRGGTQYAPKLLLFKDGTSGSWWLRYGDTWVGYWPRSLFDAAGLQDKAANVKFGGEIIDRQVNSVHTRTDMGSGAFPSAGFGYAAYQRALRYVDLTNTYRLPTLTAHRDDADCYDIALRTSTSTTWNPHFYFGGTGYSSSCE